MQAKESTIGSSSSTPNLIATSKPNVTQFQGFSVPFEYVSSIISFQKHFQALDDDIIIATKAKSGTTWLKALVFSILNRHRYTLSNTPLNITNPHLLVPFFDLQLYNENPNPDFFTISSLKIFSIHLPYPILADSIKHSNCRIIYMTRNPFDVIVLDLGYWNMCLEKPWKVLFMRYEELKEDPVAQTKILAEFLGFPFSIEEEKTGVVNQIVDSCSFNNLKDLGVNKTGKTLGSIVPSNKLFFRSGKVGDYVNYLSPAAVERLSYILKEKQSGSGLTFK
ncbi:cytosolic sulfotransferase 14-like [Gossypium australe]|uniref:Sulfotransferase n=1 Tax=Gossypium australe TaxID=47621 RepID=A0A5B6UI99_9ROSI|nr:cytosolic sulfotransferase 14-like [Gossypium australe]